MPMYNNPNADTFTSSAQNLAPRLHHLELSVNASLQREDGTNLCVDADFEVDAFARLLLWRQEHCTMQQLSVAQLDELLCWIMQELQLEKRIMEHPKGATVISPEVQESLQGKAQYLYWHLLVLYHELDRLQQQLETLALPLREFPSGLTVLPNIEHSITEDEINHVLESGSMVAGGAERIRDFFANHVSSKEQAAFLKDEYGMGGHAPALLGNWQSDEFHDSKGMVLKKGGCEDVRLSWEKVANRIATLIERGRYAEAPKPEQSVAEETVQVQSTEAMEPISALEQPVTEPVLPQPEQPQSPAENYHITNEALGVGSPKTKFAYNVAAIQLLKQIEAEERQATPEEQEILANYVGWGGIP